MDVVINYISKIDDMDNLEKEIKALGVNSLLVQGDVSSMEDCEKMTKKIMEKFDSIDVLVNNAGITRDGLLMRMKREDFDSVIDVNLGGTFNVTRCVVPIMVKQKSGRIVNLASVVGVTGNAGQSNYSASKAGIIGFTKSLARELSSRNILVNSVAPGFIETSMTSVLSDSVKEQILTQIPLKRISYTNSIKKNG